MQPKSIPSDLAPERVVCHVVIPGNPTTKARPRIGRKGAYTPERTRAAERDIQWEIKLACPELEPESAYDVGVRLLFATSTRQRRDIDNLIKLVFDACNQIVWADDVQVVELSSQVHRGTPEPGIDLLVYRIGEPRRTVCETCGKPITTRLGRIKNERFCSKPCYDEAQRRGRYVSCYTCDRKIYRQNEKLRLGRRWFCSAECKQRANAGQLTCRQCGKAFDAYRSLKRAFCSVECGEQFMRENRQTQSRHARGTCMDCGAPTSHHKSKRCRACDYRRRHDEAKARLSDWPKVVEALGGA